MCSRWRRRRTSAPRRRSRRTARTSRRDLRRKIVNDAAAYISELAREHGRNPAAAEAMVRQASNFGAREAAAKNIVDVVSPSLPALLREIDGRVTKPKGIELAHRGRSRGHGRDVLLPEGARPADRPEHHRPHALARHRGAPGRALEPRPRPARNDRRDLAARRPLRPAGASGLRGGRADAPALARVVRHRRARHVARRPHASPARSRS